MRSGRLPDVSGLYFAVDVVRCGGVAISATGIEDSLTGARALCTHEMVERLALRTVGEKRPAVTGRRVSATGAAADETSDFAQDRALLEALERLAGHLWWHGRLHGTPAGRATREMATSLLSRWRRPGTRRTELLELPLTPCARIVIAASSDTAGRNLCFGIAARARGADAARGAVKEMIQMEFGLRVIRYRVANGVETSARERAILDRAENLVRDACAPLFRLCGKPLVARVDDIAPLAERLRSESYTVGTRHLPAPDGLTVARVTVARNWAVPAPSCGAWSKWSLYG